MKRPIIGTSVVHFALLAVAFVTVGFPISPASARQTEKPVVLKGLDPVELTQGKEVKGLDSISKQYGSFTYRFASQDDKALFEKDPAKYAVQNGGACLHMPEMPGDPNLFLVYEGKIYLAGADICLSSVKANPGAYVKTHVAKYSVAILLFPGVETIDYAGPLEVFGEAGYKTFTVAAKTEPL